MTPTHPEPPATPAPATPTHFCVHWRVPRRQRPYKHLPPEVDFDGACRLALAQAPRGVESTTVLAVSLGPTGRVVEHRRWHAMGEVFAERSEVEAARAYAAELRAQADAMARMLATADAVTAALADLGLPCAAREMLRGGVTRLEWRWPRVPRRPTPDDRLTVELSVDSKDPERVTWCAWLDVWTSSSPKGTVRVVDGRVEFPPSAVQAIRCGALGVGSFAP